MTQMLVNWILQKKLEGVVLHVLAEALFSQIFLTDFATKKNTCWRETSVDN